MPSLSLSKTTTSRIAKFFAFLLLSFILVLILWDSIALWSWNAFFEWKRQVGYFPFFLGMAILPLVGVPTTPLFVIAGATFTPVAALAGSAISIAVNLVLSYWLANRWLRRFVGRLMIKWRIEWPKHDATQALQFLLVVRFTPGIPTFVKNYVTAMSEVSFRMYLGVSWAFTFLYALGFVIMGDSLVNHSPTEAIIGILILVASGYGVWRFRRSRTRGSDQTARPLPRS